MKIVNNMKKQFTGDLQKGEIIKGSHSGDYYMVMDNGKVLNLRTLITQTVANMSYERTGIKKENITITFESEESK